jgi:hypothetical protein
MWLKSSVQIQQIGWITQSGIPSINYYEHYLSHPLQKWSVACFGIPSVISTCVLTQATHIFAGFGSILTPHWQHSLKIVNTIMHHITRNDIYSKIMTKASYWQHQGSKCPKVKTKVTASLWLNTVLHRYSSMKSQLSYQMQVTDQLHSHPFIPTTH